MEKVEWLRERERELTLNHQPLMSPKQQKVLGEAALSDNSIIEGGIECGPTVWLLFAFFRELSDRVASPKIRFLIVVYDYK
ncbi:hypothetical protein ACFX13_029868 [Malus domestica]